MTVGTLQTLSFLAPFTGSADIRLLEVGCGKGELALLLSPRIRMTAIDSSETAILAALQAGVEAHLVDFFDCPEEQFDVVLFTAVFAPYSSSKRGSGESSKDDRARWSIDY